ncbi:PH domain-containing protein [Jannaschia sp. R86511]|uniref:PH domain-containing protein n=1 Tax=Jannaschia sp. R86511 TaxID=3093853 RepID=UPI0036D276DA
MAGATVQVQGRRSPWWTVGYVTTLGGTVVTVGVGLLGPSDPELTLLTVALGLAAGCVWWLDRLGPRRITADVAALTVSSPRRRRTVRWDELRRVRTQEGRGTPHVDAALELRDGRLVSLPPGTPAGTVEAWRDGLGGGAAPPAELPQRWVVIEASSWSVVLWGVAANVVIQLLSRLLDLSLVGVLGLGVLVLVAVVPLTAWVVHRRPPRPHVVADEDGLRLGRGGRRHVPWSDVVEVRPRSRFEPVTVLERGDGSVVTVSGPPPPVVQEWHRLAGRA